MTDRNRQTLCTLCRSDPANKRGLCDLCNLRCTASETVVDLSSYLWYTFAKTPYGEIIYNVQDNSALLCEIGRRLYYLDQRFATTYKRPVMHNMGTRAVFTLPD